MNNRKNYYHKDNGISPVGSIVTMAASEESTKNKNQYDLQLVITIKGDNLPPEEGGIADIPSDEDMRNKKTQKDQGSAPVGVIAANGPRGLFDDHIVGKMGVYRNCGMCRNFPPT